MSIALCWLLCIGCSETYGSVAVGWWLWVGGCGSVATGSVAGRSLRDYETRHDWLETDDEILQLLVFLAMIHTGT